MSEARMRFALGELESDELFEPESLDLLASTIAVVFEPTPQPTPINISAELLAGILREPLNVSADPAGQIMVTSTRDQVELQLLRNKIDVRDVSGDRDQGLAKIPRIVHEFMALLGDVPLQSFGINYIVEVSKDNARDWIATKLLSPTISERIEGQLSSNHVNLILEQTSKTLTIQLSSRVATKMNVNFNVSELTVELPSAENLRAYMDEQYQALIGLLRQLES